MNAQRQARPAALWQDRPMVLADLEPVMAVEVTAYSHPWTRGNFIDSLVAGHPAGIRLDGDGEPIGYWVALPGADELHLLNVTVAPAHQRGGHGRALLAQVIALGRERRDEALWLEVRESNRAAQALYRACGFSEVGRRKGYYPAAQGREDAVVMRLALAGVGSAGGLGAAAAHPAGAVPGARPDALD